MRCPGLVVMGEVVGFESRCHILDGHNNFFTLICCKKLNCLFEKAKLNEKRPGRPILNKQCKCLFQTVICHNVGRSICLSARGQSIENETFLLTDANQCDQLLLDDKIGPLGYN